MGLGVGRTEVHLEGLEEIIVSGHSVLGDVTTTGSLRSEVGPVTEGDRWDVEGAT